jgi:Uma2 family endonuclease
MSTMAPALSNSVSLLNTDVLFRLSVADYHDMIENEILTTADRVELLDGYLVTKMPQKSPHGSTVQRLTNFLIRYVPLGWQARIQLPITLEFSEPEPDAAVVRGDHRTFDQRHPSAAECGIVVEVSDTSLKLDRGVKGPIYARAGIQEYWIINLPESQIEVYTQPSGPSEAPGYTHRQDYTATDSIPLMLDGQLVASLLVAELLP